jgi:hypothetical protein
MMDGHLAHRSVLVGDSLGAEALGRELRRTGRNVRQLAKACLERSTACLGGDLPEGMFRLLLEPDGTWVRLTDGHGIAIVGNNMPPEGCPPPRGRARKEDQWHFQRVAPSRFVKRPSSPAPVDNPEISWGEEKLLVVSESPDTAYSRPAATAYDVYGNRNTLYPNKSSPKQFSRTKQKVRRYTEAISHPGNLTRPARECDNPFLPEDFITEVYKNQENGYSGEYLVESCVKKSRVKVVSGAIIEKVPASQSGFRISYSRHHASE